MAELTIGALAQNTGTKVETIRYYERIGLMPPPARTASNHRRYGRAHARQLGLVRRARALGFSLGEIRELLQLAAERERPCDGVDAIARRHLAEIDIKITELTVLREELARMIARCDQNRMADCRIIQALAADGS
ncbi:MAG TPA: helix-turn-helix domain-containing protein [Acidisoma sp.]|uniref:MerR family transcriptional regulator n=1 Tax=Acidisoma sp. TaxID=1872115 RepID=UPI002C404435|nr:helix-turn-helix domain-containing protein [Acidisoma sp.]HTI02790.1 helix-turn-helix domain-containing protein [Acidisoma sp.]